MIRFASALAFLVLVALPARAEVDIQEVTSPGGLTAWLVEEHSIPFVALELRFRGGASLDAPGKRGAINLMTGLIEEGAGELDAQGFAEARDDLAASYRFDVGDDVLSVSARFLTENRDAAVALLQSALTDPRFDAQAIERVRGQVLAHLKSRETDPGALAQDQVGAVLGFGLGSSIAICDWLYIAQTISSLSVSSHIPARYFDLLAEAICLAKPPNAGKRSVDLVKYSTV